MPGTFWSCSSAVVVAGVGFQADVADAAKLAEQVGRRVAGLDLALVQDDDARTGHFHLGQDVGGKQDRVLLAEVLDEVAHLPDLVRVEADGRLVEDEQVRLGDEGFGEADALAVALGKVADDLAAARR